MDRTVRDRPAGDAGFSLVELLVVMLIIGVLAGVGLAVYVSQRTKAQDVDAKAEARHLVTYVEACAIDAHGSYAGCENTTAGIADSGVRLAAADGAAPAEGETSVRSSGPRTFVIQARSHSGRVFQIEKPADTVLERTIVGEPGSSW